MRFPAESAHASRIRYAGRLSNRDWSATSCSTASPCSKLRSVMQVSAGIGSAVSEFGEISLRILAGACGATLLVLATLLDEQEEEAFHARLAAAAGAVGSLGVRINALSNVVLDSAVEKCRTWMSAIYGSSIVSVRAISTNIFIFTSACFTAIAFAMYVPFRPLHDPAYEPFVVEAVLMLVAGVSAVLIARSPVRLRNCLLVAGCLIFVCVLPQNGVLLLAAAATDVVVIMLLRYLLERASRARDFRRKALVLTASFGSILLVFGPPVVMAGGFGNNGAFGWQFAAMVWGLPLLPSLVPALSLLGIVLSLLFQLALWSVLGRSIRSLDRHRIIFDHRKSAIAIGFYLLASAFVPNVIAPMKILQAVGREFGFEIKSAERTAPYEDPARKEGDAALSK